MAVGSPEESEALGGEDPTIVDGSLGTGAATGVPTPDATSSPAAASTPRRPTGTERKLGGRYQLEQPIASGGVAVVWRAFDEVLNRSVAIKLLHPHLASDPATVERFRREAIAAARLSHPNVVAIYDTGQDDEIVYLVMEFIDGPSLRDVLLDTPQVDPGIVAALGEQVAAALHEAHLAGIVHRDVKPANILLTSEGVAKVTDFGIAKALGSAQQSLTSPGTVVGTAAYVAPEQLEGDDVDARADIYALGVVLFECLTGQPAFRGDTPTATAAARLTMDLLPPRQLRADVPRALDEIIVRATRRDRSLRWQDAGELGDALGELVRSRPSDITQILVARARPDVTAAVDIDADELALASAVPMQRESSDRRRLVMGLLGAVALAVIAYLASQAIGDVPGTTAPAGPAGQLVPIAQADDFDPHGDGQGEHGDDVALAYDGDLGTAWTTQRYRNNPRFGGLKPGVGIWFDLGQSMDVTTVQLDLATAGASIQLFGADELPSREDGELGWGDVLGAQTLAPTDTVMSLEGGPVAKRYWLVWFTELPAEPAVNGLFQARLNEVRFLHP